MPRKLVQTVLATATAALVTGGAAIAATLVTTSEHLTSWTSASTVPVSTCTVTASADSWVDQSTLQQGANHGTDTSLHVESSQTLLLVNTNRRSFVKFDLLGCSIPASAAVQSATLSLYLSSAPGLSRTWKVDRVTGSWTESGVTWSNQPGATASTSLSTGTTSGVTLQATVTADVQAFVGGGQVNNGWRIGDSSENSSAVQNGQVRSREYATASQRPTLVVNYYP